MPIAHGFSTVSGVAEESVLGTPLAATQRLCIIEESVDETVNEIFDNSLCGSAARSIGQAGTRIIEGGFSYPWRVDLNDLILKNFFGTRLVDTPSGGNHTYQLDNSIDGQGLTVAFDKQVSVWEFAGYKSSSLTISGTPTDGLIISVDGFAKSLDLASAINTTGVLAALGAAGFTTTFQQSVVRIADLVDVLAAGDAFEVSEWSVELDRGLEAVEVNATDRTEALENAFRESTFTVTIPQYQSDFFVAAHRAHTSLQADIVVTNGANTKTIKMPKLLVLDYNANVGGPEFVTHEVTMQIIPDPENSNAFMALQNNDSEIEIIEA